MHEDEDNEHELYQRKERQNTQDKKLGQRQVDDDNLHSRDDSEKHRYLDEDMKLALAVPGIMSGLGVVSGNCAHGSKGEKGTCRFRLLCAGALNVFQQVHHRENDDPNDVNEVPVKAH